MPSLCDEKVGCHAFETRDSNWGHTMQHIRKHKRFKLDVMDLDSKISLVGKVEIIDMSLGGIALKADRKLNIVKERLIMLG